MADLYFTYCNECHEQRDCLPHEDEFLCVGGDEGEGLDCYTRITAAQDVLRRERLAKAEADIRASQERVCIKGNYEPDCRGSCIDIRCSCNN